MESFHWGKFGFKEKKGRQAEEGCKKSLIIEAESQGAGYDIQMTRHPLLSPKRALKRRRRFLCLEQRRREKGDSGDRNRGGKGKVTANLIQDERELRVSERPSII